jgi:hypothetical protein
MGVIREKCPSVAVGLGQRQEEREPLNKVFTILIISEYRAAFYSSDDNVMEETGGI